MVQRSLESIVNLPEQISVIGNGEALRTAFSNLLDNAVEYTPEGGCIRIDAALIDQEVTLIMANTYPTLDDETLVKIFNPFQRMQPSAAPGSGLGLAIVQKIIDTHGGSIRARNTEVGLAFTIRLPRKGPDPQP